MSSIIEPDGRDAPNGVSLPHLSSPSACIRQVIAAHSVRSCQNIVEIGGAGNPITKFLTHNPLTVTIVDPKIPEFFARKLNGIYCTVNHIKSRFQEINIDTGSSIGLILLGLSLKPFGNKPSISDNLIVLLSKSDVVVVDLALDLQNAREQIGDIISIRAEEPIVDITMTIDCAIMRQAGFASRRIIVFSR